MSKIDKFLYGGFAVIIIGGITAMLVSVFSPPKKTAEVTVETPPQAEQTTLDSAAPTVALPQIPIPDGYVGYYLDDDGNAVYVTQEQIDKGREELKRREAEEAKGLAEKEWWASRQEWIDRFPFQPTHHPEITYDPESYDPNNRPPLKERGKAYEQMRDLVQDHNFLRNFYQSKLPYTEEFEQMHDIIKEELGEMANDTILQGMVFDRLKKYHWAMTKDPEEIRWKNVKVTKPPPLPELLPSMLESLTPEQFAVYRALPGEARREMTRELRHSRDQEMLRRIEAYHNADTTEIVDVTWGEEAQKRKDSMFARLTWPHFFEPEWDESWIPEEQAIALVDRLVNEIPADGFLEMEGNLHYVHRYELELEPGDPLLIK